MGRGESQFPATPAQCPLGVQTPVGRAWLRRAGPPVGSIRISGEDGVGAGKKEDLDPAPPCNFTAVTP